MTGSEAPAPQAVAARVRHLLELSRPDDALRVLGPGLVADPHSAELLALAAHAHLLREEPERCLELAGRAAAIAPHDEWPHRLRSIALLSLDRVAEAAESAFLSVRCSPFHYLTHLQYARALSRLGSQAARDQAWAEGRRAVELAPDEPEVHLLMAHLAFPAEGAPPPALWVAREALQRALALDPGNASALNNLARVQLGLGRRAEAFGGFSDALTADPHSDVALHNVSVFLSGFLVPLYWLVAISAYLSLGASGPGPDFRGFQAVVAVLVLGLTGAVGWRLRRRVGSRLGLFVRESARRNRPGGGAAGALGVAGALVVVGPVLPDVLRPPVAAAAVGVVLVTTLALLVYRLVVRLRGPRSARGPGHRR